MSMDADIERHRRAWLGFTRFLTWGTAIVVIILALMAMFLIS
jgi:hypothetical protein